MDTPAQLFEELTLMQNTVLEVGASMPKKAYDMSNARAEYERLKNNYLIQMFAEESEETWKGKRTEAQRTAMYRALYSKERLEASLAENEYKAQVENLKALQSALTACQTRYKIVANEMNGGNYVT
jgi:hypothetical protein